MRETCYWEPNKMKKIAVVFASAGLLALAACGEKPAAEANNAAAVENVVDNAANAVENAANVVENAANVVENAANATNAQ
ncbi:hypothetical protein GCM10007897_14590 [Sphingobium jiangsuense]|nr:hypothetical protein GCM10007897_14590 [Sphingobium jiangsuense]